MYRVVRGLPQFLSDIRYVVWEGGDGPKERDKKARGRELARDFFSIHREDVGVCLEFSQCPSLHVGFHFAGYRL